MEEKNKYFDGLSNRIIRWYFYQQRGLAILNELRYLVMCIFGIYMVMKWSNPWLMAVMFVGSIPVLVFIGWIQTHRMSKTLDYLSTAYATYWAKYGFELQERQTWACEAIDKKLDVLGSKNKKHVKIDPDALKSEFKKY